MKMSKKMEEYLYETRLDFNDFRLLAILPQKNKRAVVLFSPNYNKAGLHYFCLQYRGTSKYFDTIESILDECVHLGYIKSRKAKKLIKKYNTKMKGLTRYE